jgi:hypothetical protein
MGHNMAAKTTKAKTSSKSSPKSSSKTTSKTATHKAALKAKVKQAVVKAQPASKTSDKSKSSKKGPSAAPAKKASAAAPVKEKNKSRSKTTKIKTAKSGLSKEISSKAKSSKGKASDERRSQAAALIEAAMEEDDEEDEDDEFDPEAFLAASGGKGLVRSHVMRKERVDLNLPVRFRFTKGPLVYNATLLNLSKSGLCLESKEKIKEKTVLRIEIPLPHTSELFAIQAEVIWSEKAPGSPSGKNAVYHLGMNFLPMSLAKKTVINNFIQQRRDEIVMAKIGLDRFSESVPVAGLD